MRKIIQLSCTLFLYNQLQTSRMRWTEIGPVYPVRCVPPIFMCIKIETSLATGSQAGGEVASTPLLYKCTAPVRAHAHVPTCHLWQLLVKNLKPRAEAALWMKPFSDYNTRDSFWPASSLPEPYSDQNRINQTPYLHSTCIKSMSFNNTLMYDQRRSQHFSLTLLGEPIHLGYYLESKSEDCNK